MLLPFVWVSVCRRNGLHKLSLCCFLPIEDRGFPHVLCNCISKDVSGSFSIIYDRAHAEEKVGRWVQGHCQEEDRLDEERVCEKYLVLKGRKNQSEGWKRKVRTDLKKVPCEQRAEKAPC